jgi:CRISPR-associated protein (TIGR03984 family)
MSNKIEIKPCEDVSNFADDMKSWLEIKAKDLLSSKIYLLSFHDDGVVWGKIKDDGSLITSQSLNDDRFPKFRHETLQELRLFSEKGQLHIWRIGENQFNASLGLEGYLKDFESIEESQVLHGTKTENDNDANREFTIVTDGSEGLRHAFPQKVSFKGEKRPLRLHVKHYIEYNKDDGCARIAFSRLVNVSVEGV